MSSAKQDLSLLAVVLGLVFGLFMYDQFIVDKELEKLQRIEKLHHEKMTKIPAGAIVVQEMDDNSWVVEIDNSRFLARWVYRSRWDWEFTLMSPK